MDHKYFTFQHFVVGESNMLAYAAAKAVAGRTQAGKTYSPLFIYADSGLGKTHLLHAIAHILQEDDPEAQIITLNGDAFLCNLVQAIQDGQPEELRNKYQHADAFLLDDAQFFGGKSTTQEELLCIIQALREAQKPVVFTANCPPEEILFEPLIEFFGRGLLAEIQPPEFPTRAAMAKEAAKRVAMDLTDETIAFLALNVTQNMRQIVSCTEKIAAFQNLSGASEAVSALLTGIADLEE